MRRLYIQVYLAFVLILLVLGVLFAAVWHLRADSPAHHDKLAALAAFVQEAMPGPEVPLEKTRAWLARNHARFGLDLSLFDARGELLAAVGQPMPGPDLGARGHSKHERRGVRVMLALPDGRWLGGVYRRSPPGPWLWAPVLLAVAVAIGAFPLARRLTRRLERLNRQVDALGAGNLGARVDIEGRDEVARLARSFNHAADRVERLVEAQRFLLAGASHELRSPLARLRMALALEGEVGERARDQAVRDLDELDELIGELLVGSRLQSDSGPMIREAVDLLALLAEEGAAVDADVGGVPVILDVDPTLVRRMLRNLFENARRHGAGAPIRGHVAPAEGDAVIRIEDEGPGVAEAERERIFEPFYRPAGMREGKDRGAGIGLALVRQIARHHGGEVHYAMRGGFGGFEVRLPLDPTPPVPSSPGSR